MWNNLRARHYSVLILMAIVALETSAIVIDRFVSTESEEAFTVESSFQNNSFIRSFRMADANCAVLPVRINDLVVAHENRTSAKSTDKNALTVKANEETISNSVSVDFVAAAKGDDSYSNYVEYSVQPGESLSNIASLFGSKTEAIKKANKLGGENLIKAGQTLKVPVKSNSMSYTVKKGDSLSRIASRFNVSMENLIAENNLSSHVLRADQKIKIPVANRGESLTMVRNPESAEERTKKLELVKTNKIEKLPDNTKLQMIKMDKLQVAAAVAPAKKVEVSFEKADIFSSEKTSIAMKEPKKQEADESVELKIIQPMRASVAAVPAVKEEKPVASAESTQKPVMSANAKVETLKPVVEVAKADTTADKASENETFSYKIQKGDSLLKLANRFNTTVAQIQQDNDINGDIVKVGQSIKITPNKKLYRVVKATDTTKAKSAEAKTIVNHKVQNGESLSLIAKKYNTTVSEIVSENNMSSTVVMAGQTIKVPSKKSKSFKITNVKSRSNSDKYSWKTPVKGWMSSPYGWRLHPVRKKRLFHAGIDLAAPKGTAIHSVAPGRVIYTGTRTGYGKLVIISHEKGLSTRYAHCSQILVKNGQIVKEGQLIAKVGATGVATGPHLHFEVRKNGKTQNPTSYLAK